MPTILGSRGRVSVGSLRDLLESRYGYTKHADVQLKEMCGHLGMRAPWWIGSVLKELYSDYRTGPQMWDTNPFIKKISKNE